MNILYVHEIDWNRKVVFDVQLLAEAMSMRGHNMYAVDYPNMPCTNGRIPKEEIVSRAIKGSKVHLVHPWFVKINGLNRMTAFVSHYTAIKRIIREKKIDAVVLYSVPTNGLQTLYLSDKYDIPVVFRSIDILHKLAPFPLRGITKGMEQVVYSGVDKVLTLTPKLSDYVVRLGANEENVELLPMTVDTTLFCPSDKGVESIKKRWNIKDSDKVILFMGTIFGFSGLDVFISSFGMLLPQFPNLKLLIVGDGGHRKTLDDMIWSLGLRDYVTITGFQPYSDMPSYINASDVCLLPFEENDITRDIFPGKIAQYLACGKPLVMMPLAGVKSMIEGEGQGVLYADNWGDLNVKIAKLLSSDTLRNEVGQNGMRYVKTVHDSDVVAGKLEKILFGLTK